VAEREVVPHRDKAQGHLLAIITYMFDTGSELGVLLNWYLLNQGSNCSGIFGGNVDLCQNTRRLVNLELLFWASVTVILLHRSYSAYQVFKLTHSPWRFMLQFFLDAEMLRIVHINLNVSDTVYESVPLLRYFRQVEATVESIPQIILQLVFVIQAPAEATNALNVLSIFFSFRTILVAGITQYRGVLKPRYSEFEFKRSWREFRKNGFWCINRQLTFFLAYVFFDVILRALLLSFLWVAAGPVIFIVWVTLESAAMTYFSNGRGFTFLTPHFS